MNRIKFRVWDAKRKRMADVLTMSLTEEGAFGVQAEDGTGKDTISVFGDKLHLMQFTGLLDAEGKEIYEGDVLRLWTDAKDESKFEVIFERGGTKMKFTKWPKSLPYPVLADPENWYIVGNIYEGVK